MKKAGLVLILIAALSPLSAQQTRDTLSVAFQDLPLENILDSISHKTGYFFSYNAETFPAGSRYTYTAHNIRLDSLLADLLVGTQLYVMKYEDQIIIKSHRPDIRLNKTQVSGYLYDAVSGVALSGVHVFLNGTTMGTYSDVTGHYSLDEIPKGNYTLVFSHVGYTLLSYHLDASGAQRHLVNGSMSEQILELPGVQVTAPLLRKDRDTTRVFSRFKAEFLGHSSNASRCTILNPEVLMFHMISDDTFKVSAKQPVIVNNEALGYQIMFDLIYFDYENGNTRFHVNASFDPLTPENARVEKRWRKNRLASYYGSGLHFFRSLLYNELRREGFELYQVANIENILIDQLIPVSGSSILTEKDHLKTLLSFPDHLMVVYTRESEGLRYRRKELTKANLPPPPPVSHSILNDQKSFMTLKTDSLELFKNGQMVNPEDLLITGYWSWERMADLVPVNFNPKKP